MQFVMRIHVFRKVSHLAGVSFETLSLLLVS